MGKAGKSGLSLFMKGAVQMGKPIVKSIKKGKGTLMKKGILCGAALAAMLAVCASPALAATSASITNKIENLYDLVLGIIKAAGAIVLAWGVFEFAAGYQSHDSSQQTQSLKKVISGILMCGASTVISLVK